MMLVNRYLTVFSAAFAVIYVIAVEFNLAVVTYHPKTDTWGLLTQPATNGPAMHWYGWLITALVGALVISALSLPLTRRRIPPGWIGWGVPFLVMISFLYFLRSFFFY